MKIKHLTPDLINKIAAGEVVERPASVVKELMENSLDAGAKNIAVEIINAGKDLILVRDDGCGMSGDDAALALEQHATSKIEKLEDLFHIFTFGFRGEALSSISAVSDFILETKETGSLAGTRVSLVNNEKTIVTAACKEGTKIEVRQLFKNIPARQKFLKGNITEFNHILDIFLQLALSRLDCSFQLRHNKKLIYNFNATDNLSERVAAIMGETVAGQLKKCQFKGGPFSLDGLVSLPGLHQPSREKQYFFVNSRAVTNALSNRAISDAYGSLMPPGRYPAYVLFLQIDPALVDVNVHPRKSEVRFKDTQPVFQFIYQAVNKTIKDVVWHKDIGINNNFNKAPSFYAPGRPPRQMTPGAFAWKNKSLNLPANVSDNLMFNKMVLENNDDLTEPLVAGNNWILLGQLNRSYLLVESPDSLLIIDQHALSERLNYERIKQEQANQTSISQKLLTPLVLDFKLAQINSILSLKEKLAILGFEIDLFGKDCIIINAVPSLIKDKNIKEIFQELVTPSLEETVKEESRSWDYWQKTLACKSAIKFGDKLSLAEQQALLKQLSGLENQLACAHGRPIILNLSFKEINNKFER